MIETNIDKLPFVEPRVGDNIRYVFNKLKETGGGKFIFNDTYCVVFANSDYDEFYKYYHNNCGKIRSKKEYLRYIRRKKLERINKNE